MAYMEELPSEGTVTVGSHDSSRMRAAQIPVLRRKLGIIFQDFRLLPDRTAEQNVAFALQVTGAPRAGIAARVSRALSQVGLSGKGSALPTELSGGEQQRVAIARAIVNDPFLLVADEPTGNLDERASRGVFQLLREINAMGTAVLMATHDLPLVRSSDYRRIELEQGEIVADTRAPQPFLMAR
jgi:cell division transport system ATP-binding protein